MLAGPSRTYLPEQALYVMQNEFGLIKIGRSIDPHHRLRALESTEACAISLIHFHPGQGRREEQVHLLLEEHRIAGEWFSGSDESRAAVEAALLVETDAEWAFVHDVEGSDRWLKGYWDRQGNSYVRREISRFHNQVQRLEQVGWVADSLFWDLHCLMEYGERPRGTFDRDENGIVVERTWIDGHAFVVPRFTTEIDAALSLWPEQDRPTVWSGTALECCVAAMDARRVRYRERNGIRHRRPRA